MRMLILYLLLTTVGCAGGFQSAVQTSLSNTKYVIEAGQTTGELLYEAEQRVLIKREAAKSPRPTQSQVTSKLETIREKWKPFWDGCARAREEYKNVTSAINGDAPNKRVAEMMVALGQTIRTLGDKLSELRSLYQEEKK